MRVWRDLFLEGEYMPRELLLSGLSLAEVAQRPEGAPHTIYEELWHATKWQTAVVEGDEAARATLANVFAQSPIEEPASGREYRELVMEFLAGAKKAVELGEALEPAAGAQMRQDLERLAVHNAYHLGKIVALRQVIGVWPPRE